MSHATIALSIQETAFTDQIETLLTLALVLFVVGTMLVLALRYKRCPPGKVLVIFGNTGGDSAFRMLRGGGTLVLPIIQSHDFLSLEPVRVDTPIVGAQTSDRVKVDFRCVVSTAIGETPEQLELAASRLLGKSEDEVREQAEVAIQAAARQVVASLPVQRALEPNGVGLEAELERELGKLGLVPVSISVEAVEMQANQGE